MATVLVLNGPNLNLLGSREPRYYGKTPLANIETKLKKIAADAGHELLWYQSNAEHELINRIHSAHNEGVAFVIINPAAFTHTSIALRDALSATAIPFIEVHVSNIYAREAFRHNSYFSDMAIGQICGLGAGGYEYALLAALERIGDTQ